MNPTNGKGSKNYLNRTKLKHEEMQDKWDRIFKSKKESKMKTFNIILETEDGGKISFRDIQRSDKSIIEDAIARLEKQKMRFTDSDLKEMKAAL